MILGRWSEALTREPGNLLPVMVMRKRVGRGAPMCLIDVALPQGAKAECSVDCADG